MLPLTLFCPRPTASALASGGLRADDLQDTMRLYLTEVAVSWYDRGRRADSPGMDWIILDSRKGGVSTEALTIQE